MCRKSSHLIYGFLLFVSSLMPFRLVAGPLTGIVVDKHSGRPIGGCAVFINNSTYATASDSNGVFIFDRLPIFPFGLVITSLGYKTAELFLVEMPDARLTVTLERKEIGLQEAIVKGSEKDGWLKYGKQFTEAFIGYSLFAKQCKLLNKEVLQFRYNAEDNILQVWAEEPLQIRNEATGYLITYQLDDFRHNFSTKELYFKGYVHFIELKTRKAGKKLNWEQNRATAYRGSLNHFFRSVYKAEATEQGFQIRVLKRIARKDYGRYVPVWTDTVALDDSLQIDHLLADMHDRTGAVPDREIMYQKLLKWYDSADTGGLKIATVTGRSGMKEYQFRKEIGLGRKIVIAYFDQERLSPEDSARAKQMAALTINGKPVRLISSSAPYDVVYKPLWSSSHFIVARDSQSVQFSFQDYLQVTYTGEPEEEDYGLKRRIPAGVDQISILGLTGEEGISIMANGNFYPAYNLMVEQYWAYEKLDKLLPLDYAP